MPKKVLITGINGFAGHHVWPHFAAAGYEVVGLANGEKDKIHQDGRAIYFSDLRDFDRLKGIVNEVCPTYVVHLAAISFVGHNNISEIYDVNIVGTRTLLKALSEMAQTPDAVLVASSANVYGNSKKGTLNEDDIVNPANDYAVSKIGMEYMSRQFSDLLNLIIVRPFNYTGRGQGANFLVPKIVDHFINREYVIELGNVDVSRDFTDVRAVAEYILRLLLDPHAVGNIFNICTGIPYSLQYIVDACASITGHHVNIKVNPKFVRPNEIKMLVGDPTKLHGTVGKVDNYSLEDTLRWMLTA